MPNQKSHFDLLAEKYGKRCVYCFKTNRLTIDHIIPRAKGGSCSIENKVIACWDCNRIKGDMWPDDFLAHIRELAQRFNVELQRAA